MPCAHLSDFTNLIITPEGRYTMGLYLNPPRGSKADWLEAVGKALAAPAIEAQFTGIEEATWRANNDEDLVVVCLVDNGIFDAAGVAFSVQEMKVFDREDGRMKVWYSVPLRAIREIDPRLANEYVEWRDAALT